MLSTIRAYATGWVAKVLFVLLIVSFAVWGVGDILRAPQAGGALAEVAGAEVEQREVLREFDARLADFQERAGGGLTRHQAVSFGLMGQALDATVARRLVDAHARDLNLTASSASVAAAVRADPAFQGTTGFERERFDYFLRSLGLTEQAYVESLRRDIVRARLVESVTVPVAAPKALADRLLAFREERRRGRALIVEADKIPLDPPDTATLAAYLAANEKRYEAPEYRAVTLVVLGPDDLAGEIAVEEADLRAEYEQRQAEYRTPETRQIEQLVAADEAAAREAAAQVAAGRSFAEAAEALKDRGLERTELGPLRRGDLPEELDQAVFALERGVASEPVSSAFGWHLLRVTEVLPETVRSFDEVRADLERDLRRQRAAEQLPDFATRLDDELAAGTDLKAAAERLNVPVLAVPALDRQGQNEAGEAVAADRLTPEILAAVFAAREGEAPLLNEAADGRYYLFRVDGIRPARPRTAEEVGPTLADDWLKERRGQLAAERAEALRARITDAASFEAVAAQEQGTLRREVGPLNRADQGYLAGLGPEAVKVMFETPAGAVAVRAVPALDGSAVLLVDEVTRPEREPGALDESLEVLAEGLRSDVLAQYEAALRRRYPVEVDQRALAGLMEAQAQ